MAHLSQNPFPLNCGGRIVFGILRTKPIKKNSDELDFLERFRPIPLPGTVHRELIVKNRPHRRRWRQRHNPRAELARAGILQLLQVEPRVGRIW